VAKGRVTEVGVWSSEEDVNRDVAEVIAEIIETAAIVNDGIPVTYPSATEVVVDWSVGGKSGRSVLVTGPSLGAQIASMMRGMNVFRYRSPDGTRGPAELDTPGRVQNRGRDGRFMRGWQSGSWALVVTLADDAADVPTGDDVPF